MVEVRSPTSAPHPAYARPPRRSFRPSRIALALIVCAGALIGFFWKPLHGYAIAGASYGARVGCSCRYAGGRSLSDCRKDFEPGMGLVSLSEDNDAKSVTARFPLLAKQTATYREGWGCVLQPWK
ncbi:hypothetical protein [Novosphingobium olei]|uniref:hypothetical protein n=1 Tax=Novosphingobium olei TaxID=2728851 RepID=UPI001F0F3946|nr:hypothetical protein [Novosphingobium olei]BEV02329.1 hypothetical protein NSDW_34230 [Novosphingobium olei]